MSEVNLQAITLIEEVLRDEISDSRDFSNRVADLPPFGESSDVAVALHQAHHYVADADIFLKDAAYKELQKNRLIKLLDGLRTK